MAGDDKYPESTGRRRFVKGVVGSATLTGVGVGAGAALKTATSPSGEGGGTTQYMAVENIAGPAPRGMPQIPIEIDSEGYLKGQFPEAKKVQKGGQEVVVAEKKIGGMTYSPEWFQYCGVQTYKGVDPEADQDNYFRYKKGAQYEWQADVEAGGKVHVDDFSDYKTWGNGIGKSGLGKPATVTWRSQDVDSSQTLTVQVLRSPLIEKKDNEWVNASTDKGFVAWLNKCTHFCCVPKFKGIAGSAKFNAQDDVYCPCHQSVYDPFSLVKKSFVALPRPEGDS
ncbi:cytochrome bc1 complex Rieske iron-sulfur protein [Haladaptatus paucihalophilus DX253]|uniref:Cytochrome bc1 complex Rieske iron-sulfur protein n=1 Tax=Haladaptatus paucihalophilus DX253 TaxID=797209 RepID=E7QSD1_HALPU|nr:MULTISPECIES: Rieske 2Fe-2S domain-containing protein [Haladaptatus]EFW92900.1 cytochrome bc1 complex Rieske iron-sulfur protein [Haladaptatus paucihalophilus DX253]GKZ13504.1 cytochrome b [Haladaptatus sp. T7]SHK09441.1 Rieske [2Fe-2S] domain-containing protein [Haladaptatus paucihalophilus DX253]